MGKMSETPRYNVISLRITDEELAMIHTLREESDQSVSDFMRKVLSLFIQDTVYGEKEDY